MDSGAGRGSRARWLARPGRWASLLAALASVLVGATAFAHQSVWCREVLEGKRLRTVIALPSLISLRRGALALAPEPLRARSGALRRENALASADGLSRIRTARILQRFRRAGRLVPVAASSRTYYVAGVSASLRVTRPWTRRFIEQLATAKHALFGSRLRITSLTRTAARQEALAALVPGAAPAQGRISSTHLTGAAIDIGASALTARELAWLRTVLHRLATRGLVHAVEEFNQPHFHVFVRRHYGGYARTLASALLVGGC
jgi:hypothetical protein